LVVFGDKAENEGSQLLPASLPHAYCRRVQYVNSRSQSQALNGKLIGTILDQAGRCAERRHHCDKYRNLARRARFTTKAAYIVSAAADSELTASRQKRAILRNSTREGVT
jgi:hypothetical protein